MYQPYQPRPGVDTPLTNTEKPKYARQYRELYPSLLTLALFAIFGFAVITGIRLSTEPNARFWVGRWGYALLAVPIILVISHIVQSFYRRPLYFFVIVSVCVPPLMSIFIGFMYAVPVQQVVSRLLSSDCTTFRQKFQIEQAYKEANSFFNECLAAQAKNHSMTVEAVRKDMVISQCPGYDPEASGYSAEWSYLQRLEENENCAGWCFDGEGALWTHNPTSWDSCSAAAGMTMKNKVARNASRMMWNGVIGFLVAVTLVWMIDDAFKRGGSPGIM